MDMAQLERDVGHMVLALRRVQTATPADLAVFGQRLRTVVDALAATQRLVEAALQESEATASGPGDPSGSERDAPDPPGVPDASGRPDESPEPAVGHTVDTLPTLLHLAPRSVDALLRPTRRVPRLSAEEEVRLAQDVEVGLLATQLLAGGDYPDGETLLDLRGLEVRGGEAWQRLVLANVRLAFSVSRRRWSPGADADDLLQEALLAVMASVNRFDVAQGLKFSTYATTAVRRAVGRAAGATAAPVARTYLEQEQEREVSMAAGSAGLTWVEAYQHPEKLVLDLPAEQVRAALMRAAPVLSVEEMVAEGHPDEPSHDPIGEADDARARSDLVAELLFRMEDVVGERNAQVLRLRYGFDGEPRTLAQIGQVLGLTRERVRQLEKTAVEALREDLTEYPLAEGPAVRACIGVSA